MANQAHEDEVGQLQHPGAADLAEPGTGQEAPHCLEYVVVHEMMHLLERHHNKRFQGLLDQHLPNWRALRDELNTLPVTDQP